MIIRVKSMPAAAAGDDDPADAGADVVEDPAAAEGPDAVAEGPVVVAEGPVVVTEGPVVVAEGPVDVDAGGPVVVAEGGPVDVDAGGPVVVVAEDPVDVDAGGPVVVDAGGPVDVDAAAAASAASCLCTALLAASVNADAFSSAVYVRQFAGHSAALSAPANPVAVAELPPLGSTMPPTHS